MNNLNSNKINYTLTNRKEFIEWFNKTFIKFRATGKQESIKNKYEPYNYQKLLISTLNIRMNRRNSHLPSMLASLSP